MVRSRLDVIKAMMSVDGRKALVEVDLYLAEYTSHRALDGEGMDHEVVVHTGIPLSDEDTYAVIEILEQAGWKNVRAYSTTIRFYF